MFGNVEYCSGKKWLVRPELCMVSGTKTYWKVTVHKRVKKSPSAGFLVSIMMCSKDCAEL